MADNDEKIPPVQPIRSINIVSIRPFGAEPRLPQGSKGAKVRRRPEPEGNLPCSITPEKVDCKI
ncbi:MAG: hypothetical protein P4N59_09825 [Negativicutes bacterium]|nr:hypothetical protein [Negativicutes bacterium]